MQDQELKIRDLFEEAYLICSGFELKELKVIDTGRKPKILFTITGEGIDEKSRDYRTGRATANVAMLKFTMEKLKDAMFAKIRENDQRRVNSDS